jgi:hypothetical protein
MKIVGCGCSWTHGFYWTDLNRTQFACNNSWLSFLADKIHGERINISFPGASNYAIAKQVEYAISLKPDLVIVNTTTDYRIDLKKVNTENFSQGGPTIRNFNYGPFKNEHIDYHNEVIYSNTFSNFTSNVAPIDDIYSLTKFILRYDTYVNFEMRKDQNKFLIMGTLALLERFDIPYICVDFTDMLPVEYSDRVLAVSIDEMLSTYPIKTDRMHFNQDGHRFLSELIHQRLVNYNII